MKALPPASPFLQSFTILRYFVPVIQVKSLLQSLCYLPDPQQSQLLLICLPWWQARRWILPRHMSCSWYKIEIWEKTGIVGKGSNVIALPGKWGTAWHKDWLWVLIKHFSTTKHVTWEKSMYCWVHSPPYGSPKPPLACGTQEQMQQMLWHWRVVVHHKNSWHGEANPSSSCETSG